MITHYFSFPNPTVSQIDKHFDAFFPKTHLHTKEHIANESLFEKTTVFQDPSKNKGKISLTSPDKGVLRMISHALSLQTHQFSFSFIGESAVNDDQCSYFINNSQKNILFRNTLAEQIHLIPEDNHSPLDIRLGALRQDITSARPYLADSAFLFFNINALKWSDSPAQSANNPSGLTSEEANQLAYMAGQSHKNKYLILYGFEHFDRDPHEISVNSAMQILWYYQYGATDKAQPWPITEEHRQDFTIESVMATNNLVFRKDRLTNNWFHKIPFDLPPDIVEHQWIASSHEEYLGSANEDLPNRLLEWYELLESH